MKLSLQIANLNSSKDIYKIKSAITVKEGILACEVKQKGVVSIVFDNYSISEDDILDSLEENGYVILKKL